MKLKKEDKNNLLYFLNKATLTGNEAIILANLLVVVSEAEEIKEELKDKK